MQVQITDNLTGITTINDIEAEELVEASLTHIPAIPTAEERLEALESAVLEMIIGGAV